MCALAESNLVLRGIFILSRPYSYRIPNAVYVDIFCENKVSKKRRAIHTPHRMNLKGREAGLHHQQTIPLGVLCVCSSI